MKALLTLILATLPLLAIANGVERGNRANLPLDSIINKTSESIILREVKRRCTVRLADEAYIGMYLDPNGSGVAPNEVYYRVHVQILNKRSLQIDTVEVDASAQRRDGRNVNVRSVRSGRCR